MTVEVDDQFGNPMAGEKLQPSLGSTDANYSATKSYAVITTGSNGLATFSLTDQLLLEQTQILLHLHL